MLTKPSHKLTLHDKLSRLSPVQANKVLGPEAAALIPKAGQESIDIASQVLFTADQFQVHTMGITPGKCARSASHRRTHTPGA